MEGKRGSGDAAFKRPIRRFASRGGGNENELVVVVDRPREKIGGLGGRK